MPTAPRHARPTADADGASPALRAGVRVGAAAVALGAAVPVATAGSAAAATTTVRTGDTLTAVAARTGTTVAALTAANRLPDPDRLRPGQRLVVPAPAAAASTTGGAAQDEVVVVVRPGDTLTAIAARTGRSVAALATANRLPDPDRLRPGQRLVVPPRADAAPADRATGASGASAPTGAKPPVASTFAGRTYAASVTASATAARDALDAREVPSTAQVRAMVVRTATAMGVDPALAQAVAFQESGFDARAVSPAGAVGPMQVIPSSGRWASGMVGRDLDLLDTQDNITAGVAILRSLTRTAPDRATAIAGYYQGLAGVLRNGMYPDTRRYVANVQTLTARFR